MVDPTDVRQSGGVPCPRCSKPVPTGADECPACGQSLCPECGAAVGQHWPSCLACGATWDLLCPECEAVVKPRDRKCPQCGASLDSEPEPVPAEPAPPPAPALPSTAALGSAPACAVCGRQDETLRLAAFPFVFSLLIITFRRAFSGVWCRRHRNRYRFLAGLISPLVGWFGIPFGFVYTPMVLLQMARGGIQPRDENQRLLQVLSGHKLRVGDTEGAIRCLEQGLRIKDDEAGRQRLQALYDQHRPSTHRESPPAFWPFLLALLGALALGVALGAADYAITDALNTIFGAESHILIVLLSWTPWITLLFLGGLALVQILQWALERCACRQMALGLGLAILSVIVVLYGTQQGYALADVIWSISTYGTLPGLWANILATWYAWTAGGAEGLAGRVGYGDTSGWIYLILFLIGAAYYLLTSLKAARDTVRWQQALAAVRARGFPSRARALQPGWLALGLIFACIAASAVSAPLAGFLLDDVTAIALPGEQQSLDETIAEMEAMVAENPDVGVFHMLLGTAYAKRGEFDRAAEQLEIGLDLGPEDATAHASLAMYYYLQDQTVRAEEALARAEALGANDAFAQQFIGGVYALMGDLDRAEEKLRYSVENQPDDPQAHLELARVYSLQDRPEEALASLDRALALDPALVDAHVARGYVHLRREDYGAAGEAFARALELDPEDAAAHSAASLLHYLQSDVAAALQEAEAALAIDPYDQDAHCQLALACQAGGDLDQALAAAREAVRLHPRDDMARYALGLCYRDLGREAEAIREFETFLALYRDRAYTRNWKAGAEAYLAAHH